MHKRSHCVWRLGHLALPSLKSCTSVLFYGNIPTQGSVGICISGVIFRIIALLAFERGILFQILNKTPFSFCKMHFMQAEFQVLLSNLWNLWLELFWSNIFLWVGNNFESSLIIFSVFIPSNVVLWSVLLTQWKITFIFWLSNASFWSTSISLATQHAFFV